MRSVKAAAHFGAFWGALWLLCGCVVPDDSPVTGSKRLEALSGREVIDLCDWSRDYMGGYAPNTDEASDEEPEARHRCPPSQDDLWERSDTLKFAFWKSDTCPGNVAQLGGEPCRLIVDEFETIVRALADDPCAGHVFEFDTCVVEFPPLFED